MHAMLLAEIRRWQRSGVWSVPLLGLVFGLLQLAVVGAVGTASGWDGAIAGTVMWATGLAQPTAALLLVLIHMRERRARGGGAWWRVGDPLMAGACRMLVCAGVVALTNLFVLAPAAVVGYLAASGDFPVARLLGLAGVLTLGAVLLYPIFELLAARGGAAAVLILSVTWNLTGVLTAENPYWMIIPPAWPVRAALPLLGTHANGIALAPGNPIGMESPAPAVLFIATALVALLAVYWMTGSVAVKATMFFRRWRNRKPRPLIATATPFAGLPVGPVRRTRSHLLLGAFHSLRRTPLAWLVPAGLVVQTGVVLLWNDSDYATGFAELALLPVGAVLLGVFGWISGRDAWPGIATIPHSIGRLVFAKIVALQLILTIAVLFAGVLTLAAGADAARALRVVVLSMTVGWMLLVAAHWLTARWSPGVTSAVHGVGLVVSLVLGAGEVADIFWPAAPWAWAHTPATNGWGDTSLIATLTVVIGFIFVPLAVAAAKRRAVDN